MKFEFGCDVYDLDADVIKGKVTAKRVLLKQDGKEKEIFLGEDDLVFIQNGSMTDASALGSWKQPAPYNTLAEATSFRLWEKLSRFENFGNPAPFIRSVYETTWQSFTVTMKNPKLFKLFTDFQRGSINNTPG